MYAARLRFAMSDNVFAPAVSALTRDMQMHDDFIALCECGGRRAGTDSERAALELVHSRMASIDHRAQVEPVEYAGWRCSQAAFTLNGDKLVCNPLLGSASTTPEGISAEVIDLGRGALSKTLSDPHATYRESSSSCGIGYLSRQATFIAGVNTGGQWSAARPDS